MSWSTPCAGPVLKTAREGYTTMKQRRHTLNQVIRKLAEGEKLLGQGQEIAEVCWHLEITGPIRHRWKTNTAT